MQRQLRASKQPSNTDNRCSTLSPVELKPASGTYTDDVNDGDKIHGCSLPLAQP